MATYNKFQAVTEDLVTAVHNFSSHTFKVYLSNATPSASGDADKADLAEISAGNGYTAGGATTTITISRSGGVTKVAGSDVSWTASGGSIGPFQYAVLYNDTASGDRLIAWWDYGTALTINNTQTFTVDFDATAGVYTLS